MKSVLLDSSFLISAAKEKIDIFEELQEYEILIPKQVIDETFRISQSNQSLKDREAAELALRILYNNQKRFNRIDLPSEKREHTDKLIIKYANENTNIIVATLDRKLKSHFKGRTLLIRGKKLEVI